MLNIIVCMKQVIDPEAPLSSFRIDPEAKRAIPPAGTPPVLSPFDENALESALQIREMQQAEITVISAGWRLARPVLRPALAVGASDLVLLEDEAFEDLDSYSTARVLSRGIRKIGKYDLILCGRQASDTGAGQVGPGLAELLGLPVVTLVRKIRHVDSTQIRVERILEDGHETLEVSLPCVLTVSHEVGELRYPSMRLLMAASKKPITTWKASDIGLDTAQSSLSAATAKMAKLYVPDRNTKVELVTGESPEEAGARLAQRLWESKAFLDA